MKERLFELLDSGLSVHKAATQINMPLQTAYYWSRKKGYKVVGNVSSCEQYADRIIELVNKGYGYHTIAKEIGIHRNNIRLWLRNHNIKPVEKEHKVSEDEISKRVAEHGFKYISGYKTCKSQITIYCDKCKTTFKRNAGNLYKNYQFNIKCYNCMNVEAEKRKLIGKQTRYIKSAIKKCKKDRERQRQLLYKTIAKKISQIHYCSNCGVKVIKYKYCSKCKDQMELEERRKYYKIKETNRRLKIKSNLVDRDITVKKLYQRDKGICYICNKLTDLNDYVVTDKTIVCGGAYPSIDHVIPLSKGGEHSWKNVKLAHRQCNWEKSDRTTV